MPLLPSELLIVPNACDNPKARLVCFPHSGGGASAYAAFAEHFEPLGVEVVSVSLPGHERRAEEAPFESAGEIVGAVTEALRASGLVDDVPYALFGHSLGALLAYEVARQLDEDLPPACPRPIHLFTSGHGGPATAPMQRPAGQRPAAPLHRLEDRALVDAVGKFGALSEAVLTDPDLRALVLPALRADFKVYETYAPPEGRAPLALRITALGGEDDAQFPPASLGSWGAETCVGLLGPALFPGGHFFVDSARAAVLRLVHEHLMTAWGALPPSLVSSALPAPGAAGERLMHEVVLEHAACQGDRDAIVDDKFRVTYSEMAARVELLAAKLQAEFLHGKANEVVGLLMTHDASYLTCMLGVWRAAAVLIVIETHFPTDMIKEIVESSGVAAAIVDGQHAGKFEAIPACPALVLHDWASLEAPATIPKLPRAGPEDLSILMMTSGTTGRPKQIAGTHYFLHFGHLAKNELVPYQADDDREGFNVMFVWEAVRPLLKGLTSFVISDGAVLDPQLFVSTLQRHSLTRVLTTPSLLATIMQLCAAGLDKRLAAMRTWFLCGEVLPAKTAQAFRRQLPNCKLINDYSTWESGDVAYSVVAPAPSYEPTSVFALAGQAAPGVCLAIIDPETKRLAPRGVPGELYMGGVSLSSGYFRQPEVTAERFVEPFLPELAEAWAGKWYKSGDCGRLVGEPPILEVRGRMDSTVKIRGFKVGIPLVEGAIQDVQGVGLCAVVPVYESPAVVDGLLCYIRPDDGLDFEVVLNNVRLQAVQKIPRWMMPSYFRPMPEDCTSGGESRKLDRKKLARLADLAELRSVSAAPPSEAPTIAEEGSEEGGVAAILKSVWAKALNLSPLALDLEENFFDLGGHSQLAAKIASELSDNYGLPITVLDIYSHSSLGALLELLDGQSAKTEAVATLARLGLPRGTGQRTDGIAVAGIAGRFPGADSVEAFWENLRRGAVSATFLSKELLRRKGVPEETIGHKDFVPAGYLISDPDKFDHGFFGIGRHEASLMDPQHRIFVEAAWAAMENAALSPKSGLANTVVGVFAAAGIDGYLVHHLDGRPLKDTMDPNDIFLAEIGNEKDYIATRVSYLLDFTGPSMNVNSACSSALVAVAQASASIAAGQCDAAVAGASSLTFPNLGYLYQDGLVSSVDGMVRPFDAGADGTVFGDSVGALVLRRRDDAAGSLRWATLRGFAVSNDGGKKAGYAAPSSEGQSRAIAMALEMMGEDPWSISYVECHATGTRVGDGIEIRGLVSAFEQVGGKRLPGDTAPVALGSVKGNIAHANCAAGVTGLAKALLMVNGRELTPTANFKVLNPKINLDNKPFFINSELCSWALPPTKPRRAGVSSFGIGGTNAHTVLEAPEDAPEAERVVGARALPFQLLPLSAKTPSALRATAQALADGLHQRPEAALESVAYTLQSGRAALPLRKAVLVPMTGAEGESSQRIAEAFASQVPEIEELEDLEEAAKKPAVALVFPGQGSQYFRMARGLYGSVPMFRSCADECCELLLAPEMLGFDLRPMLFPGEPAEEETLEREFNRPTVLQPALFVVEYSLAQIFKAVGVTPVAAAGHSLGEYAAAVVGGLLTLRAAAEIVAARARSTETLAKDGAMLSVAEWSEEELDAIARGGRPGLWLAAVNSPAHAVISGEAAAVEALEAELKAAGRKAAKLHVRKAFHSGLIADAAETLRGLGLPEEKAEGRAVVPVASNQSGGWLNTALLRDGSYWTDHMRGTVYWRQNVEKMMSQWKPAIVLEVGPGNTLSVLTAKCVPQGGQAPIFVQAMRHVKSTGTHDAEALLGAIGRLWEAGCAIDWRALHAEVLGVDRPPRQLRLPTYAFDRTSLWANPECSVYVDATEDPAPVAYSNAAAAAGPAAVEAPARSALLRFGDARSTEPAIRAYCLPFASGSATVFAPWAEVADEAVEVVAIELPGRGARSEERMPADDADDEALLDAIAAAILADLRAAQYVLVSFSMGGNLSVELALRMAAKGATMPLAMYVAGRRPPAMEPAAVGGVEWTNEELAAYAFAPPEVASSPEFMEHVVPLLRADLLLDNRAEKRLSALRGVTLPPTVGFEVFCGVTDEVAPWTEAAGWQRFAQAHLGMHYMPGGHEFMQVHRPLLHAAWRRDAIGRLVQRRSAELAQLAAQGFAAPGAALSPTPSASSTTPAATVAQRQADLPLYAVRWMPSQASAGALAPSGGIFCVELKDELSEETLEAAARAIEDRATILVVCASSSGVFSSGAGAVDAEVRQCWQYTRLTQRLLEVGVTGRVIVVCPVAASGALVAGCSKAVAMEAAELRIQRIFLPDATAGAARASAGTILALADRHPQETDLWVEGASLQGRVYSPRLEPMAAPSSRTVQCVAKLDPSGEPAIYLLTGATGGLGGSVVEWLVKDQGLAPEQLVLLRRQGSAPLEGVLAACRCVEVARPDCREALLASGLSELRTVTGVMHLAGVLDDGVIGGMTEERFRKVAQPKCGILAALVQAASALRWPLEWILGFSSTSSLFGYAGQSNYCAANALLDHLAAFGGHLPEGDRPPCRVLAINWGPWGEAGMAKVGTKAYEQALVEGDRPLSTAAALRCLAAGLHVLGQPQSAAVQLCACDVEWQKSQWRDLPILDLVADRAAPEVVEDAKTSGDAASPEQLVESFLVLHTKNGSSWKKIQGKSLHQLGLDSLEIVQLRNMFNKKFGTNVPLSLLADPSQKLSALAPALCRHICP